MVARPFEHMAGAANLSPCPPRFPEDANPPLVSLRNHEC